jgi:hypothetical protein
VWLPTHKPEGWSFRRQNITRLKFKNAERTFKLSYFIQLYILYFLEKVKTYQEDFFFEIVMTSKKPAWVFYEEGIVPTPGF